MTSRLDFMQFCDVNGSYLVHFLASSKYSKAHCKNIELTKFKYGKIKGKMRVYIQQ